MRVHVPLEAVVSRPLDTCKTHTASLLATKRQQGLQVTHYESSTPAERSSRITPNTATSKSGLGCNGHRHKQSCSEGPARSKCASTAGICRIGCGWRRGWALCGGFKVRKSLVLNCQFPLRTESKGCNSIIQHEQLSCCINQGHR